MPVALLIVDHGSRVPQANRLLPRLAARLRRQRPGVRVHYAHMELAGPTVAQGLAACVAGGATQVLVHPFMLSAGRHVREDIPRLVREAARAWPGLKVRITPPLGLHAKLCEVIWERAGLAPAHAAVRPRKRTRAPIRRRPGARP